MGSRNTISAGRNRVEGGRIADDSASAIVLTGRVGDLVKRLQRVERQILEENREFDLFALFLRENALHGSWDIVTSAPWFRQLKGDDGIGFIVERLKPVFRRGNMFTMISRVLALPPDTPFVKAVNEAIQVEHGLREVRDVEFAGIEMSRGYIITSVRRTASKAKAR